MYKAVAVIDRLFCNIYEIFHFVFLLVFRVGSLSYVFILMQCVSHNRDNDAKNKKYRRKLIRRYFLLSECHFDFTAEGELKETAAKLTK